jgi:EpsI family protein
MMTWLRTYFKSGHVGLQALAAALALMAGSVALAEILRPTRLWADNLGSPHYAQIVPRQFGDWVELQHVARTIVDPVQAENLSRLYTETLARTYVHKPTGRVVMLSIAYGRDQSTDTQLHTPEQCYPSQGFRIDAQRDVSLHTPWGEIQGVSMDTRMGQRMEPLTFFIRVGDRVARGSRERNLSRLRMGMQGYLVDGMLLRVSEISPDPQKAHALQEAFILDLLQAVGPVGRQALIGRST